MQLPPRSCSASSLSTSARSLSSPPSSAKSVVTQWSFAASSSQISWLNGSRACCCTAACMSLRYCVVRAVGARDADDREALGQEPADGERVERGHDLLVREVARRAEDDEHARVGRAAEREPVGERVLGHCFRALLQVPAERVAHRGEDAVAPVRLAARREAVEERGREDGHRDSFLDRGHDRPAALARIADVAGVLVEVRRRRAAPRAPRSRSHEEMTEPRRQSSAIAAMSSSYL